MCITRSNLGHTHSNGALYKDAPLLTFYVAKKFTKCTPPWIAFSVLEKIKENDGNVKKIKEN